MVVLNFRKGFNFPPNSTDFPIADELKNIKMSELGFGYQMKKIMMPDLNPIQQEIMSILKLKPDDMIKT